MRAKAFTAPVCSLRTKNIWIRRSLHNCCRRDFHPNWQQIAVLFTDCAERSVTDNKQKQGTGGAICLCFAHAFLITIQNKNQYRFQG